MEMFTHSHECPNCYESFECCCDEPTGEKQCPDCFMQLKLLEHNE